MTIEPRPYRDEHDLEAMRVILIEGRKAANGTHPGFQRKGLGKAVVCEGLRRMKARGMATAIVCAEYDNTAAQKLYESVGFRTVNRMCTYTKDV